MHDALQMVDSTVVRIHAGETWRKVAEQLRPRWPKLADLMETSEHDALASMTFPGQPRTKLHSTDEIDKPNPGFPVIVGVRRRPRGEARRIGCERRRAAQACLAELRRLRTPSRSCGGRARSRRVAERAAGCVGSVGPSWARRRHSDRRAEP